MLAPSFRASRHLVVFWDEGRMLGHNYFKKSTLSLSPDVLAVLGALQTWRTEDELATLVPSLGPAVSPVLEVLAQASLVDRRSDNTVEEDDDPLAKWGKWKPLAAALHFSTRNGVFPSDPEWVDASLGAAGAPMPEPCKHYGTSARVAFPPEMLLGTFTDALEGRRTWRSFGPGAVSIAELSTLLRFTFGVRHWHPRAPGRIAFKTSPSGGARHPAEAYVAVSRVEGIDAGLYHFDAVQQDMALLRRGVNRTDLVRYAAGQEYFGDAAVMVLMTAVFARTMWRYQSPRAYRTVHIDLGHLGQTFCLTATALGLAPFTTMALSEDAIESDLGLDGTTESAMYILGVGVHP
jgi:SagB-type dehydrogenase family enzyme